MLLRGFLCPSDVIGRRGVTSGCAGLSCRQNRHWLARSVKHPLSDESIRVIDDTYRNRSVLVCRMIFVNQIIANLLWPQWCQWTGGLRTWGSLPRRQPFCLSSFQPLRGGSGRSIYYKSSSLWRCQILPIPSPSIQAVTLSCSKSLAVALCRQLLVWIKDANAHADVDRRRRCDDSSLQTLTIADLTWWQNVKACSH